MVNQYYGDDLPPMTVDAVSGRVHPVALPSQPASSANAALQYAWGKGVTSFHGFTSERASHLLSDVQLIEGRDPEILTFQDLVLMPRFGGLYDLEGRRVEETKATFVETDANRTQSFLDKLGLYEQGRTPPQIEIPPNLPVWEEPVVLMGKLHTHYGHFLTDSQARLWSLMRKRREWAGLKLLFTPVHPHELDCGFVRLFHDNLGLRPGRVWKSRTPTLLRRVICPLPAIQLSRRIYETFDAPHRMVARKLFEPQNAPDRPVYLSRRGLDEGHRAIANEDRLEAVLEGEGYLIVRPETLSLQSQVAIFNQDQPVVGVIGSALHNALLRLGRRPQRMAIITDGAKSPRFHLVDAIKPLATSYLNAMDLSDATPATDTKLQERTYILRAEQALDYLSDAGFLPRPSRSGAASTSRA